MLDKSILQTKFRFWVNKLEASGKIKNRRELAAKLGWHENLLSSAMSGRRPVPYAKLLLFAEMYQIDTFFSDEKIIDTIPDKNYSVSEKSVRKPKIETDPQKEGILYVPIAAQAGYAVHFTNPTFVNQLERVYIPGFPYRGERFAMFEVKGESMIPTLKDGFKVVSERVDPDQWNTTPDYHIHVIVTEDQCMVKRIFKKNSEEWVLISDNEEFYKQVLLPTSKIRQVWFVHRKMDWELSPPKMFEIKV